MSLSSMPIRVLEREVLAEVATYNSHVYYTMETKYFTLFRTIIFITLTQLGGYIKADLQCLVLNIPQTTR